MLILFFIIKTIYMIAPDQKLSGKYVNRGAAFTTISWMIVTWGYSYYVNNMASYFFKISNPLIPIKTKLLVSHY